MKQNGFTGRVSNTSLHDVIQLVCVSGCTCCMDVRSGTQRGVISFKHGEIVHAVNDRLEGEEALYKILSWRLGVFQCRELSHDRETICRSWDFLLVESLRRIDGKCG